MFLLTKIAIFVVTLRKPLPSLKCKTHTYEETICRNREKNRYGSVYNFIGEGESLATKAIFPYREQPFDKFSDTEIISRYRFPRHTIIELNDFIKDRVQHPTAKAHAIQQVIFLQVF